MRSHFTITATFTLLCYVVVSGQDTASSRKNNTIIAKTISQRWELDSKDKRGTFRLTSYKPFYVTAGRWSNNPNTQPRSDNPAYSSDKVTPYNHYEAKFQLSFKAKIIQSAFFGSGDIWVGYTQKAHWQIYNSDISREFRELNYEPELLLNFALNVRLPGFTIRTAGVSFNHQSNGRDLPYSRSWNRIIFHTGIEGNHWQLVLRPWIRLSDEEDENPGITAFYGRGEATFIYLLGKHVFYAIGTNSLSANNNHGSLEVNYVFPIKANLRGQAQFFTGYGETLIDYNHRQTTLGLGIAFVDW